ncbi:MAG: hypothetical protein CML20_10980 [Rheinheimera sp.]|mgnify:FL=1|uniref:hypothetical protein n=1 Tax=Arsukibacterium sp. UBA3155 TaxID=1946058 RepID=UPI000C88FD56|nr:hypothetical protein [Arsukibacterium sp. UBA3155]MAD75295.1 hypothetical protein [Rheinheimera sp.]|tara:strand:+ start:110280 stop:110459 length:180 start_codon:yes stop_codon:yes gene_type:complete
MSSLLTSDYAGWLAKARQPAYLQQQRSNYVFLTDNTAVSFDNISYATTRISTEEQHKPE